MTKEIKSIHIDRLVVNPMNDRHGELAGEMNAIKHLLASKPSQMKKLAKDIAAEHQIYVPPIVAISQSDADKFTVFDGNRRITCLKLLLSPHQAPDREWREFFQVVVNGARGELSHRVDCLVETDQDVIDNILFRLHTGSQDGVGQIDWDNTAKAYFIERTGKKTKINIPEEIEKRLRRDSLIDDEIKVRWSSLSRLLSSEEFRYRLGLSVRGNEIVFTHEPEASLQALKRVVEDASTGTLNLNNLLMNSEKRKYLDALDVVGALPSASQALEKPVGFHDGKARNSSRARPAPTPPSMAPKPHQRRHLIRRDIRHGVIETPNVKRILDIWNELQFNHEFGKHDNGIAVLFRVLFELCTEYYIEKNSVEINKGDKLSGRCRKVASHMMGVGLIDKKYNDILCKFEQSSPLISANTFNNYAHHKDFFPSDHHLMSMWDSLERYILLCLRCENANEGAGANEDLQ